MPLDVRFGIRSRRTSRLNSLMNSPPPGRLGPADVPSGQDGSFVLRFMSAQ
jgi:hypothetical protein